MFLHLGSNVSINHRRVIAMLDLSTSGNSRQTREILRRAVAQDRLERLDESVRTLVLADDGRGGVRVILSPISSTTLYSRTQARF